MKHFTLPPVEFLRQIGVGPHFFFGKNTFCFLFKALASRSSLLILNLA